MTKLIVVVLLLRGHSLQIVLKLHDQCDRLGDFLDFGQLFKAFYNN